MSQRLVNSATCDEFWRLKQTEVSLKIYGRIILSDKLPTCFAHSDELAYN